MMKLDVDFLPAVTGILSPHLIELGLGPLSDGNVIGAAVIGLDGTIYNINDYYLDMLGYTREEFERDGLNTFALTPVAYLGTIDDKFEEYRRTGCIKAFERPRLRKDGSIVWTLIGYVACPGRSEVAYSWALDITERKRNEMISQYLVEANKIITSSTSLELLLEKIAAVTLVDGFTDMCTVHLAGDDGQLVCRAVMHRDSKLGEQAKKVLQSNPGHISDTIGPARVLRTGCSEMSTGHHAGRLGLKSYMSVPLVENGRTIAALTLTSMSHRFAPEDLKTMEALALRASQHLETARLHEELRATTEELQRSNLDLTHFASIAAHDLKSPLATFHSYLETILDEGEERLTDRQLWCIRRALETNKKMLSQVDRFLEFSCLNQDEVVPLPVNLEDAVRSAIGNLQEEIGGSGAEISVNDLPTVHGDQTLLVMLFQNLISNSIRYRSTSPLRVEIQALLHENQWTISVSDNGRGFDPQGAEKIFQRFTQLSGRGGYGIGLATCRKIVAAHQGKIWAESTPGSGSKFSFTLPANP